MTEFGIIITQDGGDISGPLYVNDAQAIAAGIDISRYRSAGDMLKEVYDTNDNGIVDAAESLTGTVEITQVNGLEAELGGLETELSEQAAGLAAHVADMDNPHNVTIAQTGAATAILGSASGDVATMEDAAALPALSAVAMMGPVQAGEGEPYPPGGGRNLLPNTATSGSADSGVSYTVNEDGSVTVNGTASYNTNINLVTKYTLPVGDYILSGCPAGGTLQTYMITGSRDINGTIKYFGEAGSGISFTVGENEIYRFYIQINVGTTVENITFYPMIRLASDTDATYAPYANIRPITGHDNCALTVTGAEGEGTAYSATFPQTVYGGSYDFVSGRLTVDRGFIESYAGEELPGPWISSMDVYSEGAVPTTGAQVCYQLASPLTYDLTPQQVDMLFGVNNVWSDTGESRVVYIVDTKTYVDDTVSGLGLIVFDGKLCMEVDG